MLKAEILKALKRMGGGSLADIVKALPWVNIHPETVRRYLLEFASAGLVYIESHDRGQPIYRLTGKGSGVVDHLIDPLLEFGQLKRHEIAVNDYIADLVDLSIRLGIVEEKHCLLRIITTGCGELQEAYFIAGVITRDGVFTPVEMEPPAYISLPDRRQLKHIGKGIYLPREMVKEDPWSFALQLIGGLAPFLILAIVAISENSKR
jgi:predicted transcriptional regulator